MIVQALGDLDQQVLIREFHHRIANELQVMTTTLGRCRRAADRNEMLPLLVELEERILAFTTLNHLLALPQVVRPFDASCTEVCSLLLRAFGRSNVTTELAVEDVPLCASDRLHVLLMVVELVVNALKHGPSEGPATTIRVAFTAFAGHARLTVSNRVGGANRLARPPRVVAALARHMGGVVSVTRQTWHRVKVRVPIRAVPEVGLRADVVPDATVAAGDSIRACSCGSGKANVAAGDRPHVTAAP